MVALAESALQKSVSDVVTQKQTQQQQAMSDLLTKSVVAPSAPLPPPIPQELTSMSDQDLISYINPSTFDQSKYIRILYLTLIFSSLLRGRTDGLKYFIFARTTQI